jgi:hypothetical protein
MIWDALWGQIALLILAGTLAAAIVYEFRDWAGSDDR